MGFIEELKKTRDGRKALERERVLFDAAEHIATAMEEDGLSKADLARLLGTQKSYITQLLDGTENMTLAKVSDVLFELNRQFSLQVSDLDVTFEESLEVFTLPHDWKQTPLEWPSLEPVVADCTTALAA